MEFKKVRFTRIHLETLLHLLVFALYFLTLNVEWTSPWIAKNILPEAVPPHYGIGFPIVYFANTFWLIPKLLKRKRWFAYIFTTLFLAVGAETLRALLFAVVLAPENAFFHTFYLEILGADSFFFGRLSYFMLNAVFVSFAYRLTVDWLVYLNIIERLKVENHPLQTQDVRLQLAGESTATNANHFFQLDTEKTKKNYRTTFTVKKRTGQAFIQVDDIAYFQAQGDFVLAICREGKKNMVNSSLKQIEALLDPELFYRINRSEIVQRKYIVKYGKHIKNRLAISLSTTNTPLYTSNSRTPNFRNWIKTL